MLHGSLSNPVSPCPYLRQVGKVRLIAQKVINTVYQNLTAGQVGVEQIEQHCLYPDGDWWCLEPTHLKLCAGRHVSPSIIKHTIPALPNAVLLASRKGDKNKDAPRDLKYASGVCIDPGKTTEQAHAAVANRSAICSMSSPTSPTSPMPDSTGTAEPPVVSIASCAPNT